MTKDPLAQIYDNMKQQNSSEKEVPNPPEDDNKLDEEILDEGLTDEAIEKILGSIKKTLQAAKNKKVKTTELLKKIDKELVDWFGTPEPELGQ